MITKRIALCFGFGFCSDVRPRPRLRFRVTVVLVCGERCHFGVRHKGGLRLQLGVC